VRLVLAQLLAVSHKLICARFSIPATSSVVPLTVSGYRVFRHGANAFDGPPLAHSAQAPLAYPVTVVPPRHRQPLATTTHVSRFAIATRDLSPNSFPAAFLSGLGKQLTSVVSIC